MTIAPTELTPEIIADTKAWTRSIADRRAVANGCYFDIKAAEYVREFFRRFLKHSKGKWAGQPFELQEFQWNEIIAPLFGWKRANGTRRYRRAYAEEPKKNGKSTLAAGLADYFLIADGENGAEVYCAAADRAQATIVFNEAANMVKQSPALLSRLDIRDSVKRITFPAKMSFLQALSAEVATKEGLNAHAVIFDELHVQTDRKMFDTLWYAGASREQPMAIAITTAGHDKEGICWEQHQYAVGVLSGELEDDEFFAYIAAAGPNDDWTKEETWKKANPSYGVTINPDEMKAACKEAQNSPSKANSFKRYRLNIWTSQETLWIPIEKWDKCDATPITREQVRGRSCHVGLDLAKTGDLTAAVFVFPSDDGFFDILPCFWIPDGDIEAKELRDRVPYRKWAEQGFIILTPGTTTDYTAARTLINELKNEIEILSIAYDPWNALHLANELREQDGMDGMLFEFSQTIKCFNEPSKYFEQLIESQKIRHGGHPVMRWNVENVSIKTDVSGNIRPVKPKHGSPKRIDGVVGAVMGLGRCIAAPVDDGSYGEGHDLIVLR